MAEEHQWLGVIAPLGILGGSVGYLVLESGPEVERREREAEPDHVCGATPLLLKQGVQAQFLIPMAVSLGFGVSFATSIGLLLVPVGYAVVEDLKRLTRATS